MQRLIFIILLATPPLNGALGQSDQLLNGTQQLLTKFQQGQMSEMLDLAEQMVQLSEKEFGPRDPDHALMVLFLALAQIDQGQGRDAELNLQKALSVVKNAPSLLKHQTPYAGFIFLGFGRLYSQRGEYGKAEQYLLESAKTLEQVGGKDAVYALPVNDLGNYYKDQGDYAKAEKYLYEAAEIRRKTLGEKHFNYGVSLNNLASLYEQMGNYRAAAIYYEDSYSIWSQTLGANHPLLATAFNNYAGLYVKTGSYAEAEKFYLKALDLCHNVYGEKHPYYTSTLSNLANVYRLARNPSKAEQFAAKCLELRPADQSVDHAYALNNLALARMDLGKLQDAEKLMTQALAIFRTQLGKNHRNVATCANNMGVINIKLDKPDKAATYLKQSLGIALERIDYIFPAMSDKEKMMFYSTIQSDFEYFYYFAAKHFHQNNELAGDMYNYTLATKALLLNVSNKIKKRILNSGDAALISLYQQWKDKKNMLARVWQMSAGEKASMKVDEAVLEAEITALEKKISQTSELFAGHIDKKRYTWKDVQRRLVTGEAAVEVVRFRTHGFEFTDTVYYAALIVKPGLASPEVVILDQGNFMETKLLTLYRNCIIHSLDDRRSYKGFWAPIAEKLAGIRKVYFSPDGVYNQISLNALRNPQTNNFVIDELDVQVVTNTKDILATPTKSPMKNAVMLGFPDYKYLPQDFQKADGDESELIPDSLKREMETLIKPLPGTLSEVKAIGDIFTQKHIATKTVTGADANEQFIKGIQSPSVLHIATHGFFLEDLEDRAEETRASVMGLNVQKAVENPLLRAGILLAGAQQSVAGRTLGPEDGILTAYEAVNLDLENTQLVVLSACETGLGEVRNGEGVYGFQRALIIAGSKSVIMSLWKVSDEVTQKLMTTFYELWISGQSKRQAFLNAQKQIRSDNPQPYYWAPFILTGD